MSPGTISFAETQANPGLSRAAELPFAPGTSPFRVKGHVHLNTRRFAERFVPGRNAAIVEAVGDPAFAAFWEQRFLEASWYDYLPIPLVGAVMARLMQRSTDAVWRMMGETLAKRDVEGIYKGLLRCTSPEVILSKMPAVHRQYFDFGRCEQVASGKGVNEFKISGFPALCITYYQTLSSHFLHQLIALAGGRQVEGTWSDSEPDGMLEGVPLVSFRGRTTWAG
jgi:hypothetical protein